MLTVTYSGLFYEGKALSVEEQIHKAKHFGFTGLAIETKRPVASPIDLSKADRNRIKSVAADQGIELCAIETMSNFTSRYMEERENNLAMMRANIELASDLGIDMIKIFAAWPGIVNDEEPIAFYGSYDKGNYFKPLFSPDLRVWHRAVEGIREVADWAADKGIILVLQNHAPVLRPGYEDVLAMLQEVDKKNVKLCLDVPLFYERQSDAYVRDAVQQCKDHILLTHYGAWNFRENKNGEVVQDPAPSTGEPINYETFIDELSQINYNGYLVSEYCLPVLKDHKVGGVEEVDKAIKISLEYMKHLVNKAASVYRRGAPKVTYA